MAAMGNSPNFDNTRLEPRRTEAREANCIFQWIIGSYGPTPLRQGGHLHLAPYSFLFSTTPGSDLSLQAICGSVPTDTYALNLLEGHDNSPRRT